jgi:hypothetical protein
MYVLCHVVVCARCCSQGVRGVATLILACPYACKMCRVVGCAASGFYRKQGIGRVFFDLKRTHLASVVI